MLRGFTKVISDLNGRDKVNKATQMGARFTFYVLTQMDSAPDLAKKCSALSGGIGHARKVDRLLKSSVEFQKALDVLSKSKDDELTKYLSILASFCLAMYFWGDNKTFLGKLQVMSNVDVKAENIRAHKFQLMGLLILLYLLSVKISTSYQQRRALKDSESDEETLRDVDNQLHLQRVQWFGYVCDIINAANNAGFVAKIKGSNLNDAQYGLLGFMSAASVLYRIWPSSK